METAMNRKQLTLGIEKCSVITFVKRNKIESVREAINKKKELKLSNQLIKVKEKDEYLGDVLHEKGLSESVKETITKRHGRIFSAIIEISSILNDYRIDSIGGLKAGLEIYELAIVPSLLHNADTWTDIDLESEKKLENLQNTMFRYLFGVPECTPKPVLRFDLGHISMNEKVQVKKLTLLHHLKHLPAESLGFEFYQAQVKLRFPGLVNECRKLIQFYSLPDIIDDNLTFSKECWKKIVKKSVKEKSEMKTKKEFDNYA